MTKLTPRQIVALHLILGDPNGMAWPGRFATAFWPNMHIREHGDGTTYRHVRRNRRNTPTHFWLGGGYLGRLRQAGLITGGMYGRDGIGREPLYITDLARRLLAEAHVLKKA